MNVASLELCKELYKLSGWQEVEQYWEHYPVFNDSKLKKCAVGNAFDVAKVLHELITPAYDLGYLLRKLPRRINREGYDAAILDITIEGETDWWAAYDFYDDDLYPQLANTPEDAACKLTIELFKQGILTKEQKKG